MRPDRPDGATRYFTAHLCFGFRMLARAANTPNTLTSIEAKTIAKLAGRPNVSTALIATIPSTTRTLSIRGMLAE